MMHRRFLSAGVLAAAIPLLRPAQAQIPATPQGSTLASPGSATELRALVLAAGAFALQSSEMARTSATLPALKLFAELETEEQRALLQAMQIAGVPVPGAVRLPDDKSAQILQLRDARGAEFDSLYLTAQTIGHQELLQLHAAAAQSAVMPAERAVSIVAVPGIRTHIAMLQGVQMQMRG